MASIRWARLWFGIGLGVALNCLLPWDARAFGSRDIRDCEESSNIERIIEACSAVGNLSYLPAGARSLALVKVGFGHFAQEKFDTAIEDFRNAIRLDPTNSFAHHELGLTLLKQGNVAGALASLDTAVRFSPNSAASRFNRANVLVLLGRAEDGIKDYDLAIRLGGDGNTAFIKSDGLNRPTEDRVIADYYAGRAGALYLAGRFKEGVADFERIRAIRDADASQLIWETLARHGADIPEWGSELSKALDAGGISGWPAEISKLVLGKTTVKATLALAKDDDQACDTHFYGGAFSFSAHDTTPAKIELSTARDICPKTSQEYGGAVAILRLVDR